jgi:hypothetical protein
MSNLNQKKPFKGQNSGGRGLYRYSLEKYRGPKTRYTCPKCGGKKEFTRYVDNATGKQINDFVGRCNRTTKCQYDFTPWQYFERNPNNRIPWSSLSSDQRERLVARAEPETSYHPFSLAVHHTKNDYRKANNFFRFVSRIFGADWANNLFDLYMIGKSSHYPGGTIFWQIDANRRVRAGKVMQYNPKTGKRVKGRQNWVHSLEIKKGLREKGSFHLEQCLFGLHLVPYLPKNSPVAIVESEKTAVLMTRVDPRYTWLATGGLQYLTADRLEPLYGRQIVLFPDAGCYEKWKAKVKDIPDDDFTLIVSNILEKLTSDEEKKEGVDLWDIFCPTSLQKATN